MKRLKLGLFIKDLDYTLNEPYQHQLYKSLLTHYDVLTISLNELVSKTAEIKQCDILLCALPVRHIISHLEIFAQVLKDQKIIIADYDPWVFFEDGSIHKGAYQKLAQSLNVKTFLVPNKTWCGIIHQKGLSAVFSQIGMQPEYCKTRDFAERKIELEFRGSKYPVRDRQFERLRSNGLDVPWPTNKVFPYANFLEHLQNVQCWAQNEDEPIVVDGETLKFRNWLWPKATEILSQGCFLIRNRDDECLNYDTACLPTVVLFDDISQARVCFEQVKNMSIAEKNERSNETIRQLKKRDVYYKIAQALPGWFND